MTQTAARNTPRREISHIQPIVHTGATVYAGGMISMLASSGHAFGSGSFDPGSAAVAVAEETVIGDGVLTVKARMGCFRFDNGEGITAADIGAPAYIVDAITVGKSDTAGTHPLAGVIVDVDAHGVWVLVGAGLFPQQGPKGATGDPGP